MKSRKPSLTTGNVPSTLLKLTIPMLAGIGGMILFNLVDTIFIGMLGTEELAAVSFTFPVVIVIGSIAGGLGIGASALISSAIGDRDTARVKRLTTDSLLLSVAIVFFISLLGIGTIEPLFSLMGAQKELLPHISTYMKIWYAGAPFVVIPMVGNNAIRATGDTKTPGIIMLTAVFVNLILDPVLIFGLGPIPGFGIAGGAVATVIARMTTLTLSLFILIKREKMVTFAIPPLTKLLNSWKRILSIGIPAAFSNLVVPLSLAVITRMVAGYGKEAVAAFGVASRIETFALGIIMALASVITPFTGQNHGAGKVSRIKEGIKCGSIFSLLWSLLLALFFYFAASPVAKLFNSNEAVIEIAATYLVIVSISYGFQGIIMLSTSVLNGIQKPFKSLSLTTMRMVVLYIPLAIVLSHLFGITGIFIGAAAANILTGITSWGVVGRELVEN